MTFLVYNTDVERECSTTVKRHRSELNNRPDQVMDYMVGLIIQTL